MRDSWQNFLRNLRGEQSLGPIVTLGDVSRHAKPGHRPCRGLGVVTMLAGAQRIERPCNCAADRFQRKNIHRIEPVLGGAAFRWLVGPTNPRPHAIGLILGGVAFVLLAVALAVWGSR